MSVVDDPGWNAWGVDNSNSRFQPLSAGGLDRAAVPMAPGTLERADLAAILQDALEHQALLAMRVIAIEVRPAEIGVRRVAGCVYWTFKAPATVKTAVFIAPDGLSVFFGDTAGNIYALDPATGSLHWKAAVDSHPAARITGSPVLFKDRLYVPVSREEGAAIDPKYPVAPSGAVSWRGCSQRNRDLETYTIPDAPANWPIACWDGTLNPARSSG
jgi:polyvinyl alcohol dehydrogenase (cytochrome)